MTPAEKTSHRLGAVLVGGSAVVFALAGVFTKAISADPLTINCWRGLVGGILVSIYVLVRRRFDEKPESLVLGWRGWTLAVIGAAASIAFISAFKYSFIANVTIIYATVPFAAALLAWLAMGERMRSRTFVAAIVSLIGVGVMMFSGLRGGSYLGDMLALTMTALSAAYIVAIRMFRDAPVVWSSAVSAFLLFGLGWFVTDPLVVTGRDALLLIAFGISFAVAVVMWTEGAKLIPAAEAGLLGAGEVPCGILLAWVFLAETPPIASIAGGVIVLCAVFWHAGSDWMDQRRRAVA